MRLRLEANQSSVRVRVSRYLVVMLAAISVTDQMFASIFDPANWPA